MCTLCQSLTPSINLTSHDLATTPTVSSFGSTNVSTVATSNAAFSEGSDAAANIFTNYSVDGGDSFSGSLSSSDGADWIEITLEAGELLNVAVQSSNSFTDVSSALYSSNGSFLLAETFFDSDETFLVYHNASSVSNTFYIEVSTFNGMSHNYVMTATTTGFQEGTYDQIAENLTTSWIGTQMAYDVSPGGTIFYNHSALTSAGQFLAEAALEAWTMVSGINFVYSSSTTSTTGMVFDDNQSGAFAGPASIIEDGEITGSTINVSTNWLSTYGTTLDSYSFVTYMHEIGHALGLDHSGPYNGTADYSTTPGGDNIWTNDSYLATLMSYFEHSDITGLGTDFWDPLTPMMSDIKAIQLLYGVAGDLRTEDTTYGDNSTAGGYYDDLIDLTNPYAVTIIDDGGVDTLDFGFSDEDNVLSLRPGESSDMGGLTNNVTIFDTTLIENAILGSGNDEVDGNSQKNYILAGGGDDAVYGNGAADRLYGQGGEDALDGGTGNDKLYGGGGNDDLAGGTGRDFLSGGGNSDTALGGDGDDKVYGNGGMDFVYGDADDDSIFGGGGNDFMDGGDGDDFLAGGRGRDTITAGDGFDEIIGGSDKDFFVFDGDDDYNVITDYQDGVDRFILEGLTFSDVFVDYDGVDTYLLFWDTVVVLEGVDESVINAGDFV